MQPQSPVVEGLEPYELVLEGRKKEYQPLHVLRSPGPGYAITSRWQPSPEERESLAKGADVYLTIWTFGMDYPPTSMAVDFANCDADQVREYLALDEELDQRIRATYAQQALARTGEENVGNSGTES